MFFNKKPGPDDDAYDALIAAFCLVSMADGELHAAELSRFIRLLAREYPDFAMDEEQLTRDVVALSRKLATDFDKGKDRALKTIARAGHDNATVDGILKLAQIAIISDNRIQNAEETIFNDIAATLGRA